MVSNLRSRKLNPRAEDKSPGESDPADGVESRDGPGENRAVSGGGGLCRQLLDLDREATLKCSICASPDSGTGYLILRYIFKALEISGHGVPWILVPLALLYRSDDPWLREILLNLLAGIFLDLIVSFILKAAVRRPRPTVNQNDMFFAVSVDNKFSFPSGHCTRAGMLVIFFTANFSLTALQTGLFVLWATMIAASRLCLGRHYITDVVCGLIIGLLQGVFIQRHWITGETLDYLINYFT